MFFNCLSLVLSWRKEHSALLPPLHGTHPEGFESDGFGSALNDNASMQNYGTVPLFLICFRILNYCTLFAIQLHILLPLF